MKKLGLSLLFLVSANTFAATQTFKVTDNNPNNYGEESIQIKTTKGNLARLCCTNRRKVELF